MIATREPRGVSGGQAEPMPPLLRYRARADACAVTMTFNGVEHRAVLDLDARGMVRPGDVAAMLEGLAGEIRKGVGR
jgi:hypothetical protein